MSARTTLPRLIRPSNSPGPKPAESSLDEPRYQAIPSNHLRPSLVPVKVHHVLTLGSQHYPSLITPRMKTKTYLWPPLRKMCTSLLLTLSLVYNPFKNALRTPTIDLTKCIMTNNTPPVPRTMRTGPNPRLRCPSSSARRHWFHPHLCSSQLSQTPAVSTRFRTITRKANTRFKLT